MPIIKWFDKQFPFDFPAEKFPEMLERIRGTPSRLADRVGSLPKDVLTGRDGAKWSIQENAGHLGDLEERFSGRLDDYDAGLETLRAADLTNRKTHEANHNDRQIDDLIEVFRVERGKFVARLELLEPSRYGQTALHPRLRVPMRIVDMMVFQGEHDDYHLARISELIRLFS